MDPRPPSPRGGKPAPVPPGKAKAPPPGKAAPPSAKPSAGAPGKPPSGPPPAPKGSIDLSPVPLDDAPLAEMPKVKPLAEGQPLLKARPASPGEPAPKPRLTLPREKEDDAPGAAPPADAPAPPSQAPAPRPVLRTAPEPPKPTIGLVPHDEDEATIPMSNAPKPPAHGGSTEQEQTIKSRKQLLFDEDDPGSRAAPTELQGSSRRRTFAEYVRETPAAPLSGGVKAALWGVGALVALLLVLTVLRVQGGPRNQGPRRADVAPAVAIERSVA